MTERINLGRHRKPAWDPSAHPRTGQGRFDFVVKTAQRGSQRHRAILPATDRDAGAIPSPSVWSGDDLSIIPGAEQNRPLDLPPVRRMDSDALRDDQGFLTTSHPFPHQDFPRDETWRTGHAVGSPVSRSETEADLHDLADPNSDVRMAEAGRKDLSEGGSVNAGVIRGNLINAETGEKLRTEVVTKWVRREEEVDSEILGTEVAHTIGASAPIVVGDQEVRNKVHMEAISGHAPHQFGGSVNDLERLMTEEQFANFERSAGLMYYQDVITGNRDRHDGNWFITENGHAVGIDTGLSYGVGWPEMHDKAGIDKRYDGFRGLQQKSGSFPEIADRVIPAHEVRSWESDLMGMRPEYVARGRGAWHDGMMRNYRQVLAGLEGGNNADYRFGL